MKPKVNNVFLSQDRNEDFSAILESKFLFIKLHDPSQNHYIPVWELQIGLWVPAKPGCFPGCRSRSVFSGSTEALMHLPAYPSLLKPHPSTGNWILISWFNLHRFTSRANIQSFHWLNQKGLWHTHHSSPALPSAPPTKKVSWLSIIIALFFHHITQRFLICSFICLRFS